jgi:hypothetical protein
VVALNLVSPSDAPTFTLDEDAGGFVGLPGNGNMLAIRWSFVVTNADARPYLALGASRARGVGRVPFYFWHDGACEYGGWGRCGYDGAFVAFQGTAVLLEFVTACRPRQRAPSTATPTAGPGRESAFESRSLSAIRRPMAARG